jgi:Dinitrogenase iron-molybdenum cofactor
MYGEFEKSIGRNCEDNPILGHNHFANQEHADHSPDQPHGFDPASHNRHTGMAQAIADCQVIICGGMGAGAYESMRVLNIQPIVTDLRQIDEALQAYISGQRIDHTEKLHYVDRFQVKAHPQIHSVFLASSGFCRVR